MVNVESANRSHKLCYRLYVILSALCTQYRHIFHYLAINVMKRNTRGALADHYYRVILAVAYLLVEGPCSELCYFL